MRSRCPWVILLAAAASCAAPREIPREPPAAAAVTAARPEEPEPTLAGNGILVYPVKNGRAQELADTLLPLLQAKYGTGVRVVAHAASNKLLVYLPPRDERQHAAGAGGSPPAAAPPRK